MTSNYTCDFCNNKDTTDVQGLQHSTVPMKIWVVLVLVGSRQVTV